MPPQDDAVERAAAQLAALADATRRRLYRLVARAPRPVSREQAAEDLDLPAHTVKFHLDRLVEDGLLEVEFRRLTGRSGPGAGRPAKLYRRSAQEVSLSLPPRRYDLLGQILVRAVEEAVAGGVPVGEVATRVAREEGRAVATNARPGRRSLRALASTLEPLGYEPRIEGRDMVLENCPFDRLAQGHTALVCGLNLDFVESVAAGLGCTDLDVGLRPSAGRCCVSARPARKVSPRSTGS